MTKGPDFELDNTKMAEIMDVFDGPDQVAHPLEAGYFYVTDPQHGGKVTCEGCCGYIMEKDHVGVHDHQHRNDFPAIHFHKKCYEERHNDPFVDRGCVLFDGSCDCPRPALYNCKRYTDHMKG